MAEDNWRKDNIKVPQASSKSVWTKRFGKMLDIGGEAADILVHVQEITPISVTSLGLRLVNSVRERMVQTPGDYFRSKEWRLLDTFGFNEYLYKVCLSVCESKRVDGLEDENQQAVITQSNGVSYGWLINENELSEGPFILNGQDRKEAQQQLGRLIWEHIGSNSCVLCSDKERKAVFQAEEKVALFESKLSLEMLGRAKTFIDKGLNRSILLLGEPGTGKSCMMRCMAEKIGGFSLRISINDLEDVNRRDLMSALFLLSPDVILVDDFDRLSNAEGFLSDLEEINRRVKLFVVSCNSIRGIDDAVIRPGRFDEMHIIEYLDPEIVNHLVGEVDKETEHVLKQLPIAFVVEFEKRKKVLGLEHAKAELKELIERSRKLELLRKRKPRKISWKKTPAQIARSKQKRVERLEKNIQAEQEYIKSAKDVLIPEMKSKLEIAKVRAKEAKERAERAKVTQRKKAAKKAAKTRARKKELERKAKKNQADSNKQDTDKKDTVKKDADKQEAEKLEVSNSEIAESKIKPNSRGEVIDFSYHGPGAFRKTAVRRVAVKRKRRK